MPSVEPVTPPLPADILGKNLRLRTGGRVNTDLPADQFPLIVDQLTGGNVSATDRGQLVCPNGVRIRPGRRGRGPRIDIPANGGKPHETIHFPAGTSWLR